MFKAITNLKLATQQDQIKEAIYKAYKAKAPDSVEALIRKIAVSNVQELKLFEFNEYYFHLEGLSYKVITPSLDINYF